MVSGTYYWDILLPEVPIIENCFWPTAVCDLYFLLDWSTRRYVKKYVHTYSFLGSYLVRTDSKIAIRAKRCPTRNRAQSGVRAGRCAPYPYHLQRRSKRVDPGHRLPAGMIFVFFTPPVQAVPGERWNGGSGGGGGGSSSCSSSSSS